MLSTLEQEKDPEGFVKMGTRKQEILEFKFFPSLSFPLWCLYFWYILVMFWLSQESQWRENGLRVEALVQHISVLFTSLLCSRIHEKRFSYVAL